MTGWVWEAYDSRGQLRIRPRRLHGWWQTRASEVARERMAVLLAVAPQRDVLRGWRVVAWPEGQPERAAVEYADDWLSAKAPRRARRAGSGQPRRAVDRAA